MIQYIKKTKQIKYIFYFLYILKRGRFSFIIIYNNIHIIFIDIYIFYCFISFMLKKRLFASYFLVLFFSIVSILLLFYQIYMMRKMSQEVLLLKELRVYYVDFLNVVTEHLKKKILN